MFGTLILVFLIYIAFTIVLGPDPAVPAAFLRSFVSSVVVGTLVAPFLALVITLIYYRLSAAHASQPYTTTGPSPTTDWEPPYPTTPADSTAARTPPPTTGATPAPSQAPPGPYGPTGPRPKGRHNACPTPQEPHRPRAPTESGPATPPEPPPPPPSSP